MKAFTIPWIEEIWPYVAEDGNMIYRFTGISPQGVYDDKLKQYAKCLFHLFNPWR